MAPGVAVDGDSPSAVLRAGVRVPKAAELVAAKIRRQIVSGDLPEGTALPPEADLVARYGVSRPTLREAVASPAARPSAIGAARTHPDRLRSN